VKWRPFFLVAAVGALMMAILPARADHVDPTRVNGSSTCASVGSTGDFSFKIAPVTFGTHTDPGPGGAVIEIFESKFSAPNTFSFSIDGGEVHDAIVKGSAANDYDYAASEGGPVTFDNDLTIPNGNSLKHVIFCYDESLPPEQPLPCGGTVSTGETDPSGSFTREASGDCVQEKNAVVGVNGEVIVFIPNGLGTSNYTGDLNFTKTSSDPNLLVLQYDPDDEGPGPFKKVPACQDVTVGPPVAATIPAGDTWCFYAVDATAPTSSGGQWQVHWSVFGMGDPRFK
jgi:hypothetical protein